MHGSTSMGRIDNTICDYNCFLKARFLDEESTDWRWLQDEQKKIDLVVWGVFVSRWWGIVMWRAYSGTYL